MAANRRSLVCAGVVMALACTRASSADSGDLGALSLEQLMDMNVHSVFGASKYEQRVTQAPSSISIVTAEDIRRFGYTNLADVLSGVRGLYVTNDRNYTYVGVRGFLRPGDYTTRVLVLIDGHRLNDNVYDSGAIGREAMLDVELIDRVEVIRGPSSSVYGSSAFLGVINVITKRGRDIDGGEIGVDLASHDTYRTRATYGDTFANGVDFLVSASHYSSAGWNFYYPEFDQRISDSRFANNNGVAAGLDDESATKFFTSLRYGDFDASLYLSSRRKQVPTASFENIFGDPGERTDDDANYLELGYKHALSSTTHLKMRGFYDLFTYVGTYANDYALPGDPPDRVLFVDEMTGRWAGTEVQLTAKPSDRYTIVLGSEYRINIRENQSAYDDIEPRPYYLHREDRSKVLGLFAQGEARLRDDFTVTAGLRYDHYGSTFDATVNPRLALIYNPTKTSAIKLLYGEAFRAPNPYERYYNVAQADAPALKPEQIKTYELVYERYFASNYRFSLSGYSYDIDGLITQVEELDDMQFFANMDDARARGVEMELEAIYQNGAILRGSWAMQRAEDVASGLELTNSPHQLVKFTGSMPLLGTPVFASLDVQYNSKTVTLTRTRSPSFVVANFTLNTHELWSGVELTAGVYNILDEDRRFPGAEEHVQETLPQEGRTYGGRFIVKF
jgi:outer membrane receptor for ferrienterochelin and colicins